MSGFVYSQKPITIESGQDVTLTGDDGTEYLDFGASYACTPAGHCHPDVVGAIQEQASDLLFVQGSYPVEARSIVTTQLAALAPGDIENVWLCNSGTEANEAALKFARSATGNTKFVAARGAFHGRTAGSLSTTWKPKYKAPYEPLLADVEFVPYGDAAALEAAVDDETAAVILEPIQGEGGINAAPAGYLQAAREVTHETGSALLFDEIQTGLGRTGSIWACENDALVDSPVVPDVLTTAKGLASGLPMGATLCADWIAEGAASHGSTFAGNPLVAAAATATLDVIVDEELPANAAAVGATLVDELSRADLPTDEVRGLGLMRGLEVGRGANRVLRDLAMEHGILALPAGRSVVRLLPPLTLTESHVHALVEALEDTLADTVES
ncbi:acetylornithine aminotransferase [Halovivax asiaticus JCM 14624]|uniref:Acetylornithine aminotransferase n=1 Tax=Halovivax asiaticus JCM 14624 TaxID=1227490 RepID=M0BPN4_9EURY|nr:aspartate aminotransferase family protein [Halovivax asiaticus]ELZ11544.1 acetylornithine aminotransferase [Halovivax asiaticus JCM 14624]